MLSNAWVAQAFWITFTHVICVIYYFKQYWMYLVKLHIEATAIPRKEKSTAET